jgi:hypothetical protein
MMLVTYCHPNLPLPLLRSSTRSYLLEANLHGDGRIGLDEFLLWMRSAMGTEIDLALGVNVSADITTSGQRDSESSFGGAGTTGAGAVGAGVVAAPPLGTSLSEIHSWINKARSIEEYDVDDVLDFVKASAAHIPERALTESSTGLTY